ncbi:hypothetical protein [Mangrovimonas sp. DI 80]|uniref:hypothetical protein n=1 Tax=Mangrovimonas sp. DI 80 TaxID=1779330 RepID=UPI00097563A2|nr:hypothetical protein [Mangrovimonas sp. DI 80]OMP32343.1 hypothetical protein BKM32_04640 [Mangrovimonas sp. DI 80]
MAELNDWTREHFSKPLDSPYMFYVVYGDFDVDFKLSGAEYHTKGLPQGIDLMQYGPNAHPEVPKSYLEGYFWETLKEDNPNLAQQIEAAEQCYIFVGNVPDTNTLNYYRDVIGLVTYLLDHGGVAVYDLQTVTFWDKKDWKDNIFTPNTPQPKEHVMILCYDEDDDNTKWFHTRGMRKYGRPDISIQEVPEDKEEAIIDLLGKLIEFQAQGGIVDEDYKIDMETLPKTMWCEPQGDFEDPMFNNTHVEIYWE